MEVPCRRLRPNGRWPRSPRFRYDLLSGIGTGRISRYRRHGENVDGLKYGTSYRVHRTPSCCESSQGGYSTASGRSSQMEICTGRRGSVPAFTSTAIALAAPPCTAFGSPANVPSTAAPSTCPDHSGVAVCQKTGQTILYAHHLQDCTEGDANALGAAPERTIPLYASSNATA